MRPSDSSHRTPACVPVRSDTGTDAHFTRIRADQCQTATDGGTVTEQANDRQQQSNDNEKIGLDRSDDDQSFVDTSKIDFDPDDGLYSGTAVDGTSEIPGPHQDGESGEVDMDEARKEAEEGGVDPEETPAAKSPVAKAAEAERENRGEQEQEEGEKN
jgi:hypothetical protein